MRHHSLIGLICLICLCLSSSLFAAQKAIVLDIIGSIGPATEDYFDRGLTIAETNHAAVVILRIDSADGLQSTMRNMNEMILNSPIPIITYVAPPGAKATSAGTFILYASHLAAMAPRTNIGAASPGSMMTPTIKTNATLRTQKNTAHNATQYLEHLANLRGRNPNFAAAAVEDSKSISADQAKQMHVIDEIADDLPKLLQKMEGHKITLLGTPQIIKTHNLEVVFVPPGWRFEFLSILTNPNVAYLLLLLAIYGLFIELSRPGLILPGVIGLVSLFLALFAFQIMPINYAGITLLFIGIAFMLIETIVSTFGLIAILGVIAFVLGSILSVDSTNRNYHLDFPLTLVMSFMTIAFFFLTEQIKRVPRQTKG